MADLPYILFPLYFSFLPWLPYRPHVSLYSRGTTRKSEARLLLLIYVSISVFIHYPPPSPHPTTTTFRVPSCGLPFDPTVSSITIVLLLLRNQTKHKMYTEQIHIPALSFMCLKVKIFPKLKGSEKLNSFPLFLSILPKSIPDYAVVVEY